MQNQPKQTKQQYTSWDTSGKADETSGWAEDFTGRGGGMPSVWAERLRERLKPVVEQRALVRLVVEPMQPARVLRILPQQHRLVACAAVNVQLAQGLLGPEAQPVRRVGRAATVARQGSVGIPGEEVPIGAAVVGVLSVTV